MGVFECRWVVKQGWAIIGDVVCGGGIIIGDVAHERVVVVASLSSLLVMWYVGGGVIIGDVVCGGWHRHW